MWVEAKAYKTSCTGTRFHLQEEIRRIVQGGKNEAAFDWNGYESDRLNFVIHITLDLSPRLRKRRKDA
jgi:hypothetical protein